MPDYSRLSARGQRVVLNGFFAALAKATPRDQLSSVLALAFGMTGLQPTGTRLEDIFDDEQASEAVNRVCDEAADAVLEVLARHGATFRGGT